VNVENADLQRRLHRAVRALDDFPQPPGWNHSEIQDILSGTQLRTAAVLVGLVQRDDGLAVLLTQRNEHLTQHGGQISFPGGAAESSDVDAIATALRETREEIGVGVESITPFGYLDCFETVSGFSVTPVVAEIASSYVAAPDAREVAAVFEVPLAFFMDENNLRRRRMEYRGRPRDIFEFHFGEKNIWGATAAMLLSLVRRLEAVT
jgi:8-oxo-dGTP pyrophosphatase MutT (NUDIX family)